MITRSHKANCLSRQGYGEAALTTETQSFSLVHGFTDLKGGHPPLDHEILNIEGVVLLFLEEEEEEKNKVKPSATICYLRFFGEKQIKLNYCCKFKKTRLLLRQNNLIYRIDSIFSKY